MGIYLNNQRIIPIGWLESRNYVRRVEMHSLQRPVYRWEGGQYDTKYYENYGAFKVHPCVVNIGSPRKEVPSIDDRLVENLITLDYFCPGTAMPTVSTDSSGNYSVSNGTWSNGMLAPNHMDDNSFVVDGYKVSHNYSGLMRAYLASDNPWRTITDGGRFRIFAYYLVNTNGGVTFGSNPLVCNVKSKDGTGNIHDNDCTLDSFHTLLSTAGRNLYTVKTTGTYQWLKSDNPKQSSSPFNLLQYNLEYVDMPRLRFTLNPSSDLRVLGFGYEVWPYDRPST